MGGFQASALNPRKRVKNAVARGLKAAETRRVRAKAALAALAGEDTAGDDTADPQTEI